MKGEGVAVPSRNDLWMTFGGVLGFLLPVITPGTMYFPTGAVHSRHCSAYDKPNKHPDTEGRPVRTGSEVGSWAAKIDTQWSYA
jgi:hypothetical protein